LASRIVDRSFFKEDGEIFKAAIEPITRDVYKESRSGLW